MSGDENNDFYKNLLIGRIGEQILESIFAEAGAPLARFGIEANFPTLQYGLQRKMTGCEEKGTNLFLRRMPDYAFDSKGAPLLIEVKTSASRQYKTLSVEDYKAYEAWGSLIFIIYLGEDAPGIYVVRDWGKNHGGGYYAAAQSEKYGQSQSVAIYEDDRFKDLITKDLVDRHIGYFWEIVTTLNNDS
ncbi:hypothetical protein [Gluconobacter kanchanaburiensis]|uniref:Uncharacterized protein n=1 Tax=Gluconobacter kanchanaburiensis NBRC 103587 TaxID=1307948 RepID=A0A511B5S9_9PROT|nr:hypothetical protein [Gluconobacter kanchanaburiensis]MBF0860760.1 hypothetical protein [Gluconobacter kanchanaburiensis]GBR69741.1 hypothetical protein AA103587_1496 [Gluconobacter kanchanaburiensis NBRC 103587]GEK95062.1 hypothetical protein GKA01_02590 [Gluconobacter kanchanaburiensis NBRC 103587]